MELLRILYAGQVFHLFCTRKANALFSVVHLYWLLLLPSPTTSTSPLHLCVGNAVKNCPNMLPETFRVSLHCRWVNCVKIFNPINHDGGLIRINVLI